MVLPALRDQRRDPGLGTGLNVRLAEVAAVRQQGLGPAQRLGKPGQRLQRGAISRLSLVAWTTSAVTTSRLPLATVAWAL